MNDKYQIKVPRKLIEVALPLDAINAACAYEKMPGIGPHPRGIHLWWARRPLAAARAIIFAQLVNDPGYCSGRGFRYGKNKKAAEQERARLFDIMERLVPWGSSSDESVLSEARREIHKSWREVCELNKSHPDAARLFNPDELPAFHDPFAGGGAIPLEAQRLGLESHATDLNPVAVMLNKAMIEICTAFKDQAPISKGNNGNASLPMKVEQSWTGLQGIAQDVRHYAKWIVSEAKRRVGDTYTKTIVTKDQAEGRSDLTPLVGSELPNIAWLWARTVRSPNPAFSDREVPLVSSFVVSNKKNKEAYIEPIVSGNTYRFVVRTGKVPKDASLGTKASSRGANFRCLLSGAAIAPDYIRQEGQRGRIGQRLMCIVADGPRSRIYLSPTGDAESTAKSVCPQWSPDVQFFQQALGFRVGNYGMTKWSDVYTGRQINSLATLSDLVGEMRAKAESDLEEAGGNVNSAASGNAYVDALCVYLAFAVDRCADFNNTLTRWVPGNQKVMNLFGKQTVSMTWDFPEAAILEETVGGFLPAANYIADCIERLCPFATGFASQASAQTQTVSRDKVVSTDPPYYDNIGYADLSDFFYVWLRKSLRPLFPDVFATMTVPKSEELVATPARHGSRDSAETFFLEGMKDAIENVSELAHPCFPVTIYYAFKQSETRDGDNTSSTGWETFLEAVIEAGFSIVGTWPLRSEQEFRMRGMGSNALASSILLVCQKRGEKSETVSRRQFLRQLNTVLPDALDEMTRGIGEDQSPVAPVDLSQAIIGPGMAVFSKYEAVLEADGSPMTVRTALQLINRFLAEDDFDADTQFCLHWFEQHGWGEDVFGEADVLARAKSTSVDGLADAGVLTSGGGRVQLLRWGDYPADWNPQTDTRIPIWEVLHQLIRALRQGGESAAGRLLSQTNIAARAEAARQLAYRLYTLCERKGWAEDARAYNELITSWSAIESAAPQTVQNELF